MNNGSSKSRSLILVSVLVALVILLASWFLLLSPVLSGAAEANSNAEQQEQTNDQTQVEVNKLKGQYAHLDEYQTQLGALQVQIPTSPSYPDLQRMFAAIAAEHHVVITTLQFGAAKPMATTPPPSAGAGDSTSPSPSPTPTPAPTTGTDGTAAPGPTAVTGLYAIPVSLSVVGAYDDVMSVLKELQTGDGRLVLITDVTLNHGVAGSVTTPAGGSTADTSGVFAGSVFVLTSSTPTEAPTDSGTSPSPSPSPSPSSSATTSSSPSATP